MWHLRAGGHPVDTDEIVKGHDLGAGRHVLFEPEEIDDLKLEGKRTIDLVEFVSQGEPADEAYGVLRDALWATPEDGGLAGLSCAGANISPPPPDGGRAQRA
jgi:non-homologous end joining protein Ku